MKSKLRVARQLESCVNLKSRKREILVFNNKEKPPFPVEGMFDLIEFQGSLDVLSGRIMTPLLSQVDEFTLLSSISSVSAL